MSCARSVTLLTSTTSRKSASSSWKKASLVRGLVYTANRQGFRTISEAYLFTNEDIDHILEEAYQRRGKTHGKLHARRDQRARATAGVCSAPASNPPARGA